MNSTNEYRCEKDSALAYYISVLKNPFHNIPFPHRAQSVLCIQNGLNFFFRELRYLLKQRVYGPILGYIHSPESNYRMSYIFINSFQCVIYNQLSNAQAHTLTVSLKYQIILRWKNGAKRQTKKVRSIERHKFPIIICCNDKNCGLNRK